MVLVALDHVANACDEGAEVARIATELVVVGVRLDVRLVDDVEAQPVAQVEPVRVVRVVGAADRVEVELLHQPRIRLHQLARDGPASRIVVVMAVDAVDRNRPSVDEQAPLARLDAAKADVARDALAVPGTSKADDERVEGGVLCRPAAWRADRQAQRVAGRAGIERRRQDRPASRIEQARLDRRDVGVRARHPRVDRERPVPVVVLEFSPGEQVGDVGLPGRIEQHLAGNARMPPLVLVLDEARVGPADDCRQDLIRPRGVDEVGDVELGRGSRVLGEPHRPSVDDHVEHPFDAAEMQHDTTPAPSARQGERAAVEPRRIVLGHVRGRRVERHHDVRVVRRLVAEHRPEARHLDRPPTIRACGSPRCKVGTVDQAELPSPVERPKPPRARPVERGRERGSRERRERRPGRQRSEACQLGTLPARGPAREEECRERIPGSPPARVFPRAHRAAPGPPAPGTPG